MTAAAVEAGGGSRAPSTLTVSGLSKDFGGVHALRTVSLSLGEGDLVGLIGPNGSGKTTLLNCISGVFRPSSGSVTLDGEPIQTRPVHRVARAGVVRTFQNVRLFTRLTVAQNVEVSAVAAGRVPRGAASGYARRLLDEFSIVHLADRYAGTLSYGDQRRLEIARALAAQPRFLLLDEPAAGMNEAESDELRQAIERIRVERGCGILLVEHDLQLIMRLCERIYVLNEGVLISQGSPEQVRVDPTVIAAYIGEPDAAA